MYLTCKQRGLHEAWGYFWRNWYSPQRWKLWACSSSKTISCFRTTMAVEHFWKQLKHDHLHHLLHPRLDQLVWILIHKVTRKHVARSDTLDDGCRLGRAKALTPYQKRFKEAWRLETKKHINSKITYCTDVLTWTCNCGRQKYEPHLLCKHLCQAVSTPSDRLWREIHCCCVYPFYQHPELMARSNDPSTCVEPGSYIDPDGNVSDRDDRVYYGDTQVLSNGAWRDLKLKSETLLGKRGHCVQDEGIRRPGPVPRSDDIRM